MVTRILSEEILKALSQYPIVAITGPRQSGKTTLSKNLKPTYVYVNLEDLSLREFASTDPKGFLETYQNGVIIDEIQYVPSLFSYLQVVTDEREITGEYIITGSQNFLMLESITQSLAGRVAIFNLLPFSLEELKQSEFTITSWEQYILSGSFPRQWKNQIEPFGFFENYVQTYVERDVRLMKNINNLDLFHKFIQLLAGRVGQLFNQSSLGNELGVDNKTIQSWMTLLEASFIAFRFQPYHHNFNKRLVKTPKIYFYDTGLICYLLGIRTIENFQLHFAKGLLFENLVVLELMKNKWNKSWNGNGYFWRDNTGHEIDILWEDGQHLKAIEIKSAKTIRTDFFVSLNKFNKISPSENYLVFGGNELQKRSNCNVIDVFNLNLLV